MPMFRQSKRNSRIDRDMISGPLGDFRHTMHIGRGGEVFGDTSFLSKPGSPPDRAPDGPPSLPSPVAGPAAGPDARPAAQPASAKAKFSAPDEERSFASRGGGDDAAASSPATGRRANGKPAGDGRRVANGHPKPERSSGSDVESYDNCGGGDAPSSSPGGGDPSVAFDFDLGPSMLDDILSIMDTKGSFGAPAACAPSPERRRRDPAPAQTRESDGGKAAAGGRDDRWRAGRAGPGDGYGAPRNWNHDSGLVVCDASSPRRERGEEEAAAARGVAWPGRAARSAGSHASSCDSSAESGVACEDGRRQFSSGSFDKLSDDEPGEIYTFDDDDDDEIRV